MIPSRLLLTSLIFAATLSTALGLTLQELTQRAKKLPTVAEKDLPQLKNEPEEFPGIVKHDGLEAHTWVRFPFVENPGSIGIDRKGRVFVGETNRFWQGVPDLRGVNALIRDDFKSVTVEDRTKLYEKYASLFPEGFFTDVADRLIRLEDKDGNGAADYRTLFSDDFSDPLDGLGFSILAEDDAVYFTCIPNVWKLTDEDDDGEADSQEAIVEGFGARVSFIGHDLHGITRGPDGRLYFSVGDRGYHVTTEDGEVLSGPGRGAIFRCESDGSGFEVYCKGLRNPQELAFDDYGNLFTFDNTGDIGDLARMVYALEGTDSGWNMAHQSAHHYVTHLDWGEFHPPVSMWVAEKMFETYTEQQPQWVYPPASHVARGPSGVTFLTGETLPEDLRGKFLLANYRGPSENCTILTVGIEPKGAGYAANSEDVLVEGVGVTDVELGFDGNIYLCDFGGGWEVNTQGAIQVLSATDEKMRQTAGELESIFKSDFSAASVDELVGYLSSPDRRLRQFAQFELVKRPEGTSTLEAVARDADAVVTTRLHAIWGLGQIWRQAGGVFRIFLDLSEDTEPEIRANAARTLGEIGDPAARGLLVEMLGDDSARVRSLAAVALGRVAKSGDEGAIDALYSMAAENGSGELDPVLRHACLSALDHVGTVDSAMARVDDPSREVRLMAVLFLRRHESAELAKFLDDSDPLILREAVRAIYDTGVVDGPAGDALAGMGEKAADWPETVQRRVVAANFRRGQAGNAQNLVAMAGDENLAASVRAAALHGLAMWGASIVTDPVLGTYRPLASEARSQDDLKSSIGPALTEFLSGDQPPALVALAINLATGSNIDLDETTLREQIGNGELDADVRVAALDSLVGSVGAKAGDMVGGLLTDDQPLVAAAAIRHGFTLELDGVDEVAGKALISGSLPEARASIEGIATRDPKRIQDIWATREQSGVRPQLWLDLFLAVQQSASEEAKAAAAAFVASSPQAVFTLSEAGGDPNKGALVFRNQGACLQCHKIGKDGGIQGPVLTKVGERLKPDKIVESLVNPGAEIAEGYGSSVIRMKNGNVLMGRIVNEETGKFDLIGIDGKTVSVERSATDSIAPPISAMPPLGASLAPRDLRDLVAYLSTRTSAAMKAGVDGSSHGEDEKEAIAK